MLKSFLGLIFLAFVIFLFHTPVCAKEDDYNKGRVLLETRCSSCHKAYQPKDYTITEWKGILNRMGPRASLRSSEIEAIMQYLKHNRQKKSEN